MHHLISVVGARPQFIKAAVLSRRWKDFSGVRERIVHTGQHFDDNLSRIFFEEMDIPNPAWNLGIGGLSHGQMTARMIERLEKLFQEEKPNAVIVYGDTNSTLAGALAAAKLQIPVAHVEAGLRSFERNMPEEQNRVVTDHLATWLYCPTQTAVQNLVHEGIADPEGRHAGEASSRFASVILSGDVMYEGFLYYRDLLKKGKKNAAPSGVPEKFILCTLHRQENTDDAARLKKIVRGLNETGEISPVFLPLHPRTRERMKKDRLEFGPNVKVTEPLSYLTMVYLLDKCRLVITDSGGLQKEACFAKKPCVTLRDQTEWIETVKAGWNRLCRVEHDSLAEIAKMMIRRESRRHYIQDLYGEPEASRGICRHLIKMLEKKGRH